MENSANDMSERDVEAARYALLRRLAPAIRHCWVGKLHPIGLIAAAPDLANVQESIANIDSLARSAMSSFASLITWLARDDGATTIIGDGINECLSLLQVDLDLWGFSIENEVRAPGVCVSLNAVRNVLTSALIAVTDSAQRPANLLLVADVSKEEVLLSILIRPSNDVARIQTEDAYRRLEWNDVHALAQAESVTLSHNSERVDMRYSIKDKNITDPASLWR